MFEAITSPSLWAIALAGAGVVYLVKSGKLFGNPFKMSFSDLVKQQIVEDEFDGRSLLAWIKQNQLPGEIKILVAKPTKFWMKKIGLKGAEHIDTERNLIACILDAKNEEVVKIQLFSFSKISDDMREKFAHQDEIIFST